MKILFVCLGNICRSSAAEEIMRQKVKEAGLEASVEVDSAGLIGYHEGELPDPRMRSHAWKRGYKLTHRSRPVKELDFYDFDLILAMDDSNYFRLLRMAPDNECESKVHRMVEYLDGMDVDHVPDPYYGGADGFEHVLDLLEEGCRRLIENVRM